MTKRTLIPVPQITHLLKHEAVLWAARPGLWRSLIPGDLIGLAVAIAAICGAALLYLDHAALSAAYDGTVFEDKVAMDRRQLRWTILLSIIGASALLSTIAKVWRVTGTHYAVTASRAILASRSLTGAFTVALPLRAERTTALGKDLFGCHVVLPTGDVMGTAEFTGLTQIQAGEVLTQYESLRERLPRTITDDEART